MRDAVSAATPPAATRSRRRGGDLVRIRFARNRGGFGGGQRRLRRRLAHDRRRGGRRLDCDRGFDRSFRDRGGLAAAAARLLGRRGFALDGRRRFDGGDGFRFGRRLRRRFGRGFNRGFNRGFGHGLGRG